MRRQKPAILSWQMVDDEQTWQQLTAGSTHSSNTPGSNTRHWVLSASVFVLMLASLLGAYLYRQASTGLAQVESELTTAVETETWAASNGSQAIRQGLLDPTAPASWRSRVLLEHGPIDGSTTGDKPPAEVRPLLFRDGVALVQVRERATNGSVYVEHRFYRETEDGWVRTAPHPALWGPMQYRETRFFRFTFRARDAAAVATVADRIDALYTGLLADLDLPSPDDAEKLSIYVTVPEAPQIDMLRLSVYFVREGLKIPSPELLPVLETAVPAQALEQTIYRALIRTLFQQRESNSRTFGLGTCCSMACVSGSCSRPVTKPPGIRTACAGCTLNGRPFAAASACCVRAKRTGCARSPVAVRP